MTASLWLAGVIVVLSIAGVVWSMRMVAAARHRESQARQEAEEAQHIKNDFVSMVSHELRTPLTSITGFAHTLTTSWEKLSREDITEFLGYIIKQSTYLGDLVEDILVIPRLEAGRLRLNEDLFDLGTMIEEVAFLIFPPGGGQEASVSIPHGVRAHADANRVQQVVRNLLENAKKYGGDQILIEGVAHGEQYVIVVSDNGPGVPDELSNSIFDHFEQVSKGDARSSSGIGLGLPIARSLARAMGGDVWHERRFPTGSRFCFSLPANSFVGEEEPPSVERSEVREQKSARDQGSATRDQRLLTPDA